MSYARVSGLGFWTCSNWGLEMAQAGDFRGGVFISYRRELALEQARRLYKVLALHLGESRVFFDERDGAIPKGSTFTNEIEEALKRAHVILIVIVPGWLESILERAKSSDEDWVLKEVELALERFKPGTPAEIHVVLLGGAEMPKASKLLDSIKSLATINAYSFPGESWADDHATLAPFLHDVCARVPRETTPFTHENLNFLREEVSSGVLESLVRLSGIGAFKALREKWVGSLEPINPSDRLEEFRSCLETLNERNEVSRSRLSSDDVMHLKADCVAVVAELFLLGACEIVSRLGDGLDVLGNYTSPAQILGAETQAFAVAYCQGKRKGQIDLSTGNLAKRNHFSVKRVLDQDKVVVGIDDDLKQNLLKQLWSAVPEFTIRKPDGSRSVEYPKEFSPDIIRDLSIRLNAMGRDKSRPRVTLAIQAVDGFGAHQIRVWLEQLKFGVDVLGRSDRSAAHIADDELALRSAAWACLKQIDDIGDGRKRNDGK